MDEKDLCPWCDEPIAGTFKIVPHVAGPQQVEPKHWHPECIARSIIGGVNHQRGTCSCCGGQEAPDPPDLSRHEAAIAAVRYWEAKR
jgi:hypothetical protein